MTKSIEAYFCDLYGCDTAFYFKRGLRQGYTPEQVNADISKKIQSIWDILKQKDGFEPVAQRHVPQEFI